MQNTEWWKKRTEQGLRARLSDRIVERKKERRVKSQNWNTFLEKKEKKGKKRRRKTKSKNWMFSETRSFHLKMCNDNLETMIFQSRIISFRSYFLKNFIATCIYIYIYLVPPRRKQVIKFIRRRARRSSFSSLFSFSLSFFSSSYFCFSPFPPFLFFSLSSRSRNWKV